MRPFIVIDINYSMIPTFTEKIEFFQSGNYVIFLFEDMDSLIKEYHNNISHSFISVAVDLSGDNLLNILAYGIPVSCFSYCPKTKFNGFNYYDGLISKNLFLHDKIKFYIQKYKESPKLAILEFQNFLIENGYEKLARFN